MAVHFNSNFDFKPDDKIEIEIKAKKYFGTIYAPIPTFIFDLFGKILTKENEDIEYLGKGYAQILFTHIYVYKNFTYRYILICSVVFLRN